MNNILNQIVESLTDIKNEQVCSKYISAEECRKARDIIDKIILFARNSFDNEE